jgi:hypothetical protein
MTSEKDTVLIYGNCQAEDVHRFACYIPCLADKIEFKAFIPHRGPSSDWDAFDTTVMSNVTTVWEQVETGAPSAARVALHERIPSTARVVRFPSLSLVALWPFAGSDPRMARSADPPYAFADSIGARLAGQDASDQELFDRYIDRTTRLMPDLDRRLERDMVQWRERDALCDIVVGDWIANTFRETNLFHNWSHVSGAALRFLLRSLALETLAGRYVPAELLRGEVDCLLRDHQGQDWCCMPIHPLVAERMKLRFYDPYARYRWYANEWTFQEYIVNYIRWAAYCR